MDTSTGTAYMAAAHPRYKNLAERSEQLQGRLNTLRQRYAMHEATHAEYGIIRARNLQRALQTLKNRSKACETRNKAFMKEFDAMEERAAHVNSVSFAKRALQRSLTEFSRIVTARRPAWQQQTMRNKEKRMKDLEKEKQKLEAQRLRSTELFKHERELSATLAKKREETYEIEVKLRKESLERQIKLEKLRQLEDEERRRRELSFASGNDKLTAELQALADKRAEEERQHELALKEMRHAEQLALTKAASRRLEMPPPAPVTKPLSPPAGSQIPAKPDPSLPQTKTKPDPKRSPQKQAEGVLDRDIPSPKPSPAANAPLNQNADHRDENEEIQRRMQERLEAEQATRRMRQEALREEQQEMSSLMNISTVTSDRNESSMFLDGSERVDDVESVMNSWTWDDWVNVADVLVEHIQKPQNREDLQFGYGDPNRAWGHMFLQTSETERKNVLAKAHFAAMERMGGKARREINSLGMLQWCTGFCELLRCVAEGLVGVKLIREKLETNSVLGVVDINAMHSTSGDGRDELWRTLVAHFVFLRDNCKLAPTYVARTFGLYLTPHEENNGLSDSVKSDKLVAGLLLEILAPKPNLSPPKPKLSSPKQTPKVKSPNPIHSSTKPEPSSPKMEPGSGKKASPPKGTPKSPKILNDNLSRTSTKNSIAAPSPMSMFMQPKTSLTKQKDNSPKKPKIGVLDKVRRGYSFGDDDFDEEEEAMFTDLTKGSAMFGTSKTSATTGENNDSFQTTDKKSNSVNESSANLGQVSEVIELESYEDSFDDDF